MVASQGGIFGLNSDWTAVQVTNGSGRGPVLLICEHASDFIPQDFDLGLSPAAQASHAAWDIGALDVAVALSGMLDAPLVAGGISRLVYDCNRPLTAPDCIPARSEVFDIPGNANLSDQEKQSRFDRVHTPFHDAVDELRRQAAPQLVVTIHSFTPIYNGTKRDVELGFLFHSDPTTAQALLAQEQLNGTYRAALNEPYAATDGVTYSLQKHGEAHGIPAVMIEIRNDLIDTGDTAHAMAQHLNEVLRAAFPTLFQEASE
jgi:predicted N-formylglutamate amidohydrolase